MCGRFQASNLQSSTRNQHTTMSLLTNASATACMAFMAVHPFVLNVALSAQGWLP